MAVLTISVSELDLLRVRRTSDSTENDVNLREWEDGTLDTFVGANDGCVTTWFDASGNGNDVTQSTTTLQPKVAVSGTVQEGVVFDGVDDYLTLGARLTSGSITALTVAAWVKTTSANNFCIASEYDSSLNKRAWFLGHNNGVGALATINKLTVWISGNGTTRPLAYSGGTTINDGAWHHVAFTFSSGTLLLYVDGVAETLTKHADTGTATIYDGTESCVIGAINEGSDYRLPGSLSDVFMQQAALTAGNIATLAAGGEVGSPLLWLKGNYSPPTALDVYRVRETGASSEKDFTLTEVDNGVLDGFVNANDGALAKWYDSSGNENHVTQSTTTLQPKVAISGTVQEGVVFDGSNDYMIIADSIVTGTSLTMMCWLSRTGNVGSNQYAVASGNDRVGLMSRRGASSDHIVAFIVTSAGTTVVDTGVVATLGTEYHLALTWDGSSVKVYLDGILKDTQSRGGTISYQSWFTIGARSTDGAATGTTSTPHAGMVSDVRAYATALSEADINTAMAGGEVGSPLLWLKGNYSP